MRFNPLCPVAVLSLIVSPLTAQEAPQARRAVVVDTLHGRMVVDPYRWMEQPSAELTAWVKAQDAASRSFAADYAGRAEIARRIERAARVDRFSPVAIAGGLYYVMRANGDFSRRWIVALDRQGREREVLPAQVGEFAVAGARVSPDGSRLAYQVRRSVNAGGWVEVRFRDLASGRDLVDRLTGVSLNRSSLAWLPDGSGLYYERYPLPPAGQELTARLGQERLYFHRLGTPQEQDQLVHDPANEDIGLVTRVSPDGRYLVVEEGVTGATGNRVLLGRLGGGRVELQPLVSESDAAFLFLTSRKDTLWFQTTRGSPRGRVIAIAAGARDPSAWREVVPESGDVIEPTIGASGIGDHLVVAYRHDAWLRVRLFGLDGRLRHEVRLPKVGSIWTGFVGGVDGREAMFVLTDFADPGTLYALDLASGRNRTLLRPELGYDPDRFVTRQVFYEARDGTRIPMFLSERPDGTRGRAGPRPVILYGYGAFGWAASPWFRPDLVAWMDQGGMFAMPNIRGGGEFGEAWHQAAVGRLKPVAIDDYLAAAEWLMREGYTTSRLLVGNGGSAGGPLVGAAMVRRPDLFAAITLDYPALDMLRLDQYTGGRAWRSEFGSTERAEDFEALLAYSPYHSLRAGTCYPATMVLPGELDQTTVPMHAYKFVAALRAAQRCDRPILLRVAWEAGHAAGANLDDSMANWADQLAFLGRVLNLGDETGDREQGVGDRARGTDR
jgi:prolyl oligopeptidase